jgi:hypothetical protein
MAINYSKLASTAKRLIGSNGTKCKLINPSGNPPVYDPLTNTYVESNNEFEGVCIIGSFDSHLIDGTVIKVGDVKVTAVLPAEPKAGLSKLEVYDKAGTLKETYNVINANPVNPNASTVIMFKLQCRR